MNPLIKAIVLSAPPGDGIAKNIFRLTHEIFDILRFLIELKCEFESVANFKTSFSDLSVSDKIFFFGPLDSSMRYGPLFAIFIHLV